MPRGSEYANDLPQSDNAIEAGQDKIHGASGDDSLKRASRTAEFPEGAIGTGGKNLSAQGSTGHSSGKGGHEPKSLGENKGFGAL